MKKKICFIGRTEKTCRYIADQLNASFGDYAQILICPIEKNAIPIGIGEADIYIATSNYSLEKVQPFISAMKPVLIANRTLNIENINQLLKIKPNTKVLLVQTSHEMAMESIDIIKSFGIKHISLVPYYPGCSHNEDGDIDIAVTTGMSYLIPPFITNVIDLGTNDLDISTYSQICEHIGIPRAVLNTITHKYISSILKTTLESIRLAQENKNPNMNPNVILKTSTMLFPGNLFNSK
jgi:hypothetical protein